MSRAPKRRRALSRRRFMSLIAAGSALALTAPARGLAAPAKKPATPAGPARKPAALAAEIEKQKKNTAAALKVIRDYQLPPGSPMAFEFRPMRRRGK